MQNYCNWRIGPDLAWKWNWPTPLPILQSQTMFHVFFVHFVFYFLSYFALFNESSKLGELSLQWTITQKPPILQGAEPAFEIWESKIKRKKNWEGQTPKALSNYTPGSRPASVNNWHNVCILLDTTTLNYLFYLKTWPIIFFPLSCYARLLLDLLRPKSLLFNNRKWPN
jgi:hypothetical protein